MPKDYPDHHDAELVLRFYELRREPVMREARASIATWFPKTADEATAVMKSDHPHNTAFRQVTGYWEMVYGMGRHGVIHEQFLMENCGEGLFVFARFNPFLAEFRKMSPRIFKNAEWAATETAHGRDMMVYVSARIAAMAAAK